MAALLLEGLFLGAFLAIVATIVLPATWRQRWLAVPVGLVAGIGLVAAVPAGSLSYVVSFTTMAGIYAIIALALNTQWGYTGHLNFGIAGFFAVGAFTSALVTIEAPTGVAAQYTEVLFGLEQPFLVGVVAAALVSAGLGYLIGAAVLRLRMDFLAIATIGVAEIIRLIFQNERWLANGPQPLRGIPRPAYCLFESAGCSGLLSFLTPVFAPLGTRDYGTFYVLIVAIVLGLLYYVIERLCRSPWGRMLRAVRDEEASAAMNGKHVARARIQSFVLGSAVMGVAGALYAHYSVAIDYSHFQALFATFLIWVMLMLGGSGNNRGAIVGAFTVWAVWSGTGFLAGELAPVLDFFVDGLGDRAAYIRWLLVALLLAGIVLFRPQGLLKEEKIVSRYLPEWRRQSDTGNEG